MFVFVFACVQMLRMYHLISFGPFTAINGSDVQGYVAVNGPMTMSRYSVSDQMRPPSGPQVYTDGSGVTRTTRNDLVVCGDLTFISGAVMGGGNTVYTGLGSNIMEPLASLYPPGQFIRSSECPLDFEDAKARLRSLSHGLASYVRTGTSVIEFT